MDTPHLVNGRLMWVELMTSDLDAAKAFYTTVVGWSITPFDGMGAPYSMWTRPDGGPMGGLMALADEHKTHGIPPHWIMYIGVSKLEDAVSRAEHLGARALTPVIDVPKVGRLRVMNDPQGAMFSLYEAETPPTELEKDCSLGDVSWIELMTTDSAAALTFYQDLFGWRGTENMDMGPVGTYRMFGRHLGSMGGMMTKPAELANVPPNWTLYFLVPDIPAAVGRVTANGGQVINGPMDVPGGDVIVNCTDPQGAVFALHARAKAK